MSPQESSRWIPGRYPAPGESPVADAIRKRRGERGITALDAALLHFPSAAEGWNTLLGAVRTKGSLGGDVRELMILRVAVINDAAYEWIHHEPVGRQHGLTVAQLYVIRDKDAPLPPAEGILSPLQTAALIFADASTRSVKIADEVITNLREELRKWVTDEFELSNEKEINDKCDDLFVEASLVTASYNMVSRFLVSVDVGGYSDEPVPWPLDRKEHYIPAPDKSPTHTIHAVTLRLDISRPWIVFANSLLTDFTLWSLVIPYFLSANYNLLLLSQTGHGQSTLPSNPVSSTDPRTVTIPLLAADIHSILQHLNIPTPIESVIGVSQGGATALAFGTLYGPTETRSIVVCDTSPRTPPGNKEAWEERIRFVGGLPAGMAHLADVTVPRWFPTGSRLNPAMAKYDVVGKTRSEWISKMIESTTVEGFEAGARALGDYDTIAMNILENGVEGVLLLAGKLDGGGKVGAGLERFQAGWNIYREARGMKAARYAGIENSGHLPMVDSPEAFWHVVSDFLADI